ncbi:hypothetical protein BC835DRAFT_1419527 [Cytidiella melzeri]|nr:hypothetical protein BC835DRAFT_1419527 [Cytidiella melzeri]
MEFSEPWYLTVVSIQGIKFVRPERSWRPIVSITVVEHDRKHETVLGCDGRNPNLKAPIELREVHHASRIDIQVWHQSHTKKSKRKRYLVGSVYLTLGDIVRKQEHPASNITLNLKSPPAHKRSPTVGGPRQLNCAMITVRLAPPVTPPASRATTLVASGHTSDHEDLGFSDGGTLSVVHDTPPESPTLLAREDDDLLGLRPESSEHLLRRRKRSARKAKAYCINTSDEDSYEAESDSPATPPCYDPSEPHPPATKLEDGCDITFDDVASITFTASYDVDSSEGDWGFFAPRSAVVPPPQLMSRAELFVSAFSPYRELSHPQCDFSKVLSRLLTEWYAVGGSLLATAALNAAVFGYSSGATTLFAMDGVALRSVTVGSIASGIGLVIDAWFLVLYSSGDVDRFRRIAADFASLDNDPTYFYFSLACRLPAMCLFVSACALMVFLLTVAWSAWPTAVLVMCFGAGLLLMLQYLVFGVQRVVSCLVWAVRRIAMVGRRRKGKWEIESIHIPPVDVGPSGSAAGSSESLPPPPYSSPPMPSQELDTSGVVDGPNHDSRMELGSFTSRQSDS